MFKITKLITLLPEASSADRHGIETLLEAATRSNPHVLRARVGQTLPGAYNGGNLIWHVQFADEARYRACCMEGAWRNAEQAIAANPVAHVDSATYEQGSINVAEPDLQFGIHRILLLAIRPAAELGAILQFESEMREMAHYIPAIRNWGLSQVAQGTGSRQWSHVWEQEFEDLRGLNGPYMEHPYHFARVDRWFDPESTDWIVDTALCHTSCAFERSMLAPV